MEDRRPVHNRQGVVLAALLAVYVIFVLRAFQLQIVLADEHLGRAQWGVESVARYEAPRGEIVDRDGEILAGSARAVTLAFDPRLLLTEDAANVGAVVQAISRFSSFDAAEFEEWRSAPPETVPRFRVLERGVAPAVADTLLERLGELGVRSVFQQDGFRRFYPNGTVAGRALGFLDAHGGAGVAGLEMAFDDTLRGDTVEVPVARDASREPYLLGEIPDLERAAGATMRLTLDRELQSVAEDALAATLEEFRAESGVVVVSRVGTGEILVMASAPGFDPNLGIAAETSGWTNPAVGNAYEPGSTAKMLTFAAALEEGVVGWDTEFDCENGAVYVDRYRIRDRHCHGSIRAWEVIRDSSNIGALKMGMRIPQERHRAYLTAFGLGERSGVALPGEAAGLVPSLDRPWADSRHATLSYGYGLSVTPLQLNMATATIANGGIRMSPYLVSDIVAADGTVLLRREPAVVGAVVSPETASLVAAALETVVSEDGTARLAAVPGHQVAGKTGTARLLGDAGGYAEGAYLAVFTGFAPSQDARFAITVMVERPDPSIGYYGGIVAAPVFAEVAGRALELDGLVVGEAEPQRPVEHAAAAEATEGVGAVLDVAEGEAGARVVPDFTGMTAREALAAAGARGIVISVEGAGRVVEQWPPAGVAASPESGVLLTMAEARR